jgi:hypothetical protein
MKSALFAGQIPSATSYFKKTRLGLMARMTAKLLLVSVLGGVVSGCAMTQLGSMFGSSKEETTGSINAPVISSERSLALAANDMVPATQVGAVGECPRISIWKNNAHLTIYEIGRVGDNMAIKHRGEITKTARECEIAPGQVTVKYGVAGRVLLGPLGHSGPVRLPVLVHVTDRTRKKIQTNRLNVTVNMVDGKPFGNFSTVQSLSFPIEPGIPANQYHVFVTFDHDAPGAG